jgi:hypothetical protein
MKIPEDISGKVVARNQFFKGEIEKNLFTATKKIE